MISRRAIIAVCLLTSAIAGRADVILSRDGKSDYVIVIADDSGAPERKAAEDLASYLKQITDAKLPLIEESLADKSLYISVGRTKSAEKELADVKWEDLGQDGVVIRTVGDTLFLAGGQPRGTIYAVNTFLEDVVGVRWWTSDESTVPHTPTLEVPNQNLAYVPKLRYRECYNYDATGPDKRALFASRLKLNGHHHLVPSERGGHYTLVGWCHTSFSLVPPSAHFAKHPEWFAMRNGKRQGDTQLCLSNAEMRKTLIANVLALVRQNSQSGMISISQNDGYGPCECPDCKAIVEAEGSESGPWIRLCNEATEAINNEYPGYLVETLAYVYSRKPPKLVKPSKNVLVRLCSIEADFAHPLAQDSFGEDLRGWAKIAPNLFVWNYVTNFRNFLVPHPNLNAFGADLRFFTDNNVVGVFQQGDNLNVVAGDMLPLRLWLQAHLMWDPSQNQQKLIRGFLDGYYGAAGPYLAEYLKLVNTASENPAARIYCFHDNIDYLTPEIIPKCNQLFDEAEKAVADNAELKRRVKRERLALEHVNLLRYDFAAETKNRKGDAQAAIAEYRKGVRAWVAEARAASVQNFSEMQSLESYAPLLEMRGEAFAPPTLPPAGNPLAESEFDIQQDQFTLYQRPAKADLVDYPEASDGKAAKMPGNQTDWAIQFHVSKDAKFAGEGPWTCYIVARCENATGKTGDAFLYGIYSSGGFQAMSYAKTSIAGDGQYHAYGIPVNRLEPGSYFFVAPINVPETVPSISVDRIFIRKSSEP